jgi:RNA polymerase sigma-B factor
MQSRWLFYSSFFDLSLDTALIGRYFLRLEEAVDLVGYRGNDGEGQRRRSTAALLAAYHHRGDRSARTRVIEQNLPLVHSLARRFSRPSEPLDDLVQAGAIGLIKAVDGFRDDRGRDLGAYAVPTIVGELRRHVRERASASSVAELEEETLAGGARSQAEMSEIRELVRAALDVLSPRERRIVALRYYRDWSQQRIAAEVGLSQVQVSRVLSASLAKMRDRLEAA